MSAAWIIYLAEISDSVRSLLYTYFWMLGSIVMLMFLLSPMLADAFQVDLIKLAQRFKMPVVAAFFAAIIYVLLPTKNTIYLLAGAKVTEDMLQSPEAKELGGKILKIINGKLDEQLEPVKEKK